MRILRVALLTGITAAAPLLAAGATAASDSEHADHNRPAPAKLVQIVRDNTGQFFNVTLPKVRATSSSLAASAVRTGAMGVHYVNGDLVADGEIYATRPEALTYETSGGAYAASGRGVHRGFSHLAGASRQSAGA